MTPTNTGAATYTVYLSHHEIYRSREVDVRGTLAYAKRIATREFGAERLYHRIVIEDARGIIVCARQVGERSWMSY